MAEPDDEIPKINPSEVETLIKKIEQTTLSEQDKRMITRLLFFFGAAVLGAERLAGGLFLSLDGSSFRTR